MDYEGLGRRMAKARLLTGLKQRDLARALPVAPATVSNWESGKRRISLEDLCRVAVILRVPVACLVGELELPERPLDADGSHPDCITFSDDRTRLEQHEDDIKQLRSEMDRVLGILSGFTDLLKAQRKE